MADFEAFCSHPAAILVSTDLNNLDRLMPFALHDASETDARLILFHVLTPGAGINVDAVGMPYYDTTCAFEYAAKTLEAWRAVATQKQVVCDSLVREGNPAQQIAASVRQFKVGRILLGTQSRGKISKLFLGSVAEQALRSVNLPVFTVGPEAHLTVGGGDNEKVVLHATTLRETSRPSAVLACQIAATPSLASTALRELQMHVAGGACYQYGRLCGSWTRVVHGNPAIEILATASDKRWSRR